MKRALCLAVAVLAFGAVALAQPTLTWMPSRVFVGGEVIAHRFQSGTAILTKAIPYLSFGGIYPAQLLGTDGDIHLVKLIAAGSLSNPTQLEAWYQISGTGLIRFSPEIVWIGGGVRVSAKFRDFMFVRAGWSVFVEGRLIWNDFLSFFVRAHIPEWGVSTTDPFLGSWLTFGGSIEF